MPGGVEFLDGNDNNGEPDEQLPERTRFRPPRRWIWLAGAGLTALLLAGAMLHTVGGSSAGQVDRYPTATSTQPTPRTSPVPIGPMLPDGESPRPVDPTQVVATAFVGSAADMIAALRPATITLLAAGDLHVVRTGHLPELVGDPSLGPWTLIAAGDTVWAVANGINIAYAIDAATLRLDRQVQIGVNVTGAAMLGGHLYVSSNDGLDDIAPGSHSATTYPDAPVGQLLVADPTRDRLLVVGYDYSGGKADLVAFQPGPHSGVIGSAELPFPIATVVVAAGVIWAGVDSDSAGPPTRLDPRSLREATQGRLLAAGSSGARLVGAGTMVVWVRPRGSPSQLWCVSARTGAIEQRWNDAPGTVISRLGVAFTVRGTKLTPLPLGNSCPG